MGGPVGQMDFQAGREIRDLKNKVANAERAFDDLDRYLSEALRTEAEFMARVRMQIQGPGNESAKNQLISHEASVKSLMQEARRRITTAKTNLRGY